MFKYDKSTNKIEMVEHDFGIELPIYIRFGKGENYEENKLRIRIYKNINTEAIIDKTYDGLKIPLIFTEEESLLLPVGKYYYDIDFIQRNDITMNILAKKQFIVTEKAGD